METPKPFIKWAGGKHRLLPIIEQYLPNTIHVYTEPFLGGGAVLIHILQTHPELKTATANDINDRLISAYIAIQQQPDNLLEDLYHLTNHFRTLNAEQKLNFYNDLRAKFNELRDNSIYHKDYNTYLVENAATLIFLNHTCFNGLYRENQKGQFNVPYGSYKNPTIYEEDNILQLSKLFQKVNFTYGPFNSTAYKAPHIHTINHLFYLDPPYKNTFNNYHKEGFNNAQQYQLKAFCDTIDNNGINFIQSNSYDTELLELYNGYNIHQITAPRSISQKANGRKPTTELLITNFKTE